jgi:hypothetical protein
MAKQPSSVGSSPDRGAPPASAGTAPASQQDKEAERFYERLEQAGQLVDVDETTDLSTLPSRVTHVRFTGGDALQVENRDQHL